MNELIAALLPIVRAAAREVMAVYAKPFEVDYKGPLDPVTEADRLSNSLICERLAVLFPGVPLVAEESPAASWGDYRTAPQVFFVDPLDGTREFVARSGAFVIMIGLLDGERPTHGLLYAPVTGIAWSGVVNEGAFEIASDDSCRPLTVLDATTLGRARIASSRSHPASRLERALAAFGAPEVLPIYSAGLKAAAVVRGDADIYLAPESAGCRWDSCGPDALITAAGGVYSDARGKRLDYRTARLENDAGIVAAGPQLHPIVIERLARLSD